MGTPAINFSFLKKLLLSLVIVLAGVPVMSYALSLFSDSSKLVSDTASSTVASLGVDGISIDTSALIVAGSTDSRELLNRLDRIIVILEAIYDKK